MSPLFRLLLLVFVSVGVAANAQRAAAPTSDTLAVIRLEGVVRETVEPLALFGPGSLVLRDVTDRIDAAAADPRVAALLVEVYDPAMGPAQAGELHDALRRFKNSGKPLITMFDEGDVWDYLVASAGDEVVMSPVGTLYIFGLAAHLYFFEPLLGKIGMSAQVVSTGEFKTAMEPFVRPSMSEGTRIQITAMIESYGRYLVSSVAENRGLEIEAARKALWGGPYASRKALEAGLVTQLAYPEDFREAFMNANGIARMVEDYGTNEKKEVEPPSLFSLFSGMSESGRKKRAANQQIALIYALGPIMPGRADKNPFMSKQMIAAEDFIELIDEALEAGNTRAIVLRVDSPGGSAVASDRIWHHLERVRESGIPVVVSMGNVAASGGYYISMGADRIVAQPTTVTGSIGVIGGRLVVGGTYGMIGVNKQMITIGPNAGILDETRPWNAHELAVIGDLIDEMYEDFLTKAAEGRGMPRKDLETLAGGRVWTGADAVHRGLVDAIGGLDEAIAMARELANAPNAPIAVYPEEMDFFDFLEMMLSGKASVQAPLPQGINIAELVGEFLPGRQLEVFETTLSLLSGDQGIKALYYDPVAFEIK